MQFPAWPSDEQHPGRLLGAIVVGVLVVVVFVHPPMALRALSRGATQVERSHRRSEGGGAWGVRCHRGGPRRPGLGPRRCGSEFQPRRGRLLDQRQRQPAAVATAERVPPGVGSRVFSLTGT
jgi:hypothetical protein